MECIYQIQKTVEWFQRKMHKPQTKLPRNLLHIYMTNGNSFKLFTKYLSYLCKQMYYTQFRDVGICLVNLVDDSQEYTRGLFFLM